MENTYLSMKGTGNEDCLSLFELARQLDASGLSNAEVFERAERHLEKEEKNIDFAYYTKKSKKNIDFKGDVPPSFKVKINDLDLDQDINSILREKFNISTIRAPFKTKMVLLPYIDFLKHEEVKVSRKEIKIETIKLQLIDKILKESSIETLKKIEKEFE